MKVILLALSILSFNSFAGRIEVDCGTIQKVKETKKNPMPHILLKVLMPMRMKALKVKLTQSTSYSYISKNQLLSQEVVKRTKSKMAYLNDENYDKHLSLLEEAVDLKVGSNADVYVCFGKVLGLDRLHNIASYSTVSKKDALDELIRKYF